MFLVEVFQTIFQNYNYDIYLEQSWHNIVTKIENVNPNIILIDSHIAGDGVIKAILSLKNNLKFSKVPLILMGTNLNLKELAVTSMADDYIAKPFDIDHLQHTISKHIISEAV